MKAHQEEYKPSAIFHTKIFCVLTAELHRLEQIKMSINFCFHVIVTNPRLTNVPTKR